MIAEYRLRAISGAANGRYLAFENKKVKTVERALAAKVFKKRKLAMEYLLTYESKVLEFTGSDRWIIEEGLYLNDDKNLLYGDPKRRMSDFLKSIDI